MAPRPEGSKSRVVIGPPVAAPGRGVVDAVGLGSTPGLEYASARWRPKTGRVRAPPGSPGSPPQAVAPSGAGKGSTVTTQVPPSKGKSCRRVAVSKPLAVPAVTALP